MLWPGFLETFNTSDGKYNYDDFPLEDLWPNVNAVVTKLQENYVGSLGEKFVVQQHGFERDIWAGSANSPTTVLYCVHMKPRTAMFDPSHCATTPIPDGTRIVSRKTFFKDSHARRTADIEHDFVHRRPSKESGVSMFRLASLVEPRMIRTGKGRETGTGYTNPDAPLQCLEEKESSKEFSARHGDRPESKGDLEHAESARSHRGSRVKHRRRRPPRTSEPCAPQTSGTSGATHSIA